MKSVFTAICILSILKVFTQANTEIYLYNINTKTDRFIVIDQGKNISNNEGYDSQPSFLDERYIIFSSDRKGQTDIAKYDTRYGAKLWVNFSEGSEYSPLKVPNKNAVSAVRLDKDGKQRLYSYSLRNGESKEIIKDKVVAYYNWAKNGKIVASVIENDHLNLYVLESEREVYKKIEDNTGRSIHPIPNTDLVSYIAKEHDAKWQIKSLNPSTNTVKLIANTIEGVEDICWLNNKTMISSKGNTLYKLTLNKDNNWKKVAELKTIKNISRLAVNAEGTILLVVAEPNDESTNTSNNKTPTNNTNTQNTTETLDIETLVQRNLDAYNAKDIDAFMKDYAEDVKLYNYPNTLTTEGKTAMRKGYQDWFNQAKGLKATIKKRIVIGNKVIDHENVTANGQTFDAVAIYEVENGKISKVTFIR